MVPARAFNRPQPQSSPRTARVQDQSQDAAAIQRQPPALSHLQPRPSFLKARAHCGAKLIYSHAYELMHTRDSLSLSLRHSSLACVPARVSIWYTHPRPIVTDTRGGRKRGKKAWRERGVGREREREGPSEPVRGGSRATYRGRVYTLGADASEETVDTRHSLRRAASALRPRRPRAIRSTHTDTHRHACIYCTAGAFDW